jgi:hypothetical protein
MIITRARATAAQVVLGASWLGAALLLGAVVAPAAFAVLPSRSVAGDLVGRVLPVVFYWGILVYVAISLLGRWTDAASRWKPRMLAAAVGGAACALAQFVVGSSIEGLRARMGGPVDGLAASDPLRVAFGRMHALSVALLGIAMVCALIVVLIAAREPHPEE